MTANNTTTNLDSGAIQKRRKKVGTGITIFLFLLPALLLFVGIPLPGTGAWTGTLGASILDMKFRPTVLAAMGGVLLAGIIMSMASMFGVSLVL